MHVCVAVTHRAWHRPLRYVTRTLRKQTNSYSTTFVKPQPKQTYDKKTRWLTYCMVGSVNYRVYLATLYKWMITKAVHAKVNLLRKVITKLKVYYIIFYGFVLS